VTIFFVYPVVKLIMADDCKEVTGYQMTFDFTVNQVPYFPVDNARVKMFSKREKTTVHVIHKVRVMQLKSKKNSKIPK
jgi:hypothetical protein